MPNSSDSAKANVSDTGVVELFDRGSESDRVTILHAVAQDASEIWIDNPTQAMDAPLGDLGFVMSRDLLKLGRPLPLSEASLLETRAFCKGEDDAAWLEVNNAAFAQHREQGGWTQDRLEEHFDHDWFSFDDFLIHEIDGDIAGFCWTKVHAQETPPEGEIYVIAAHPKHHGKGLGRELTLAGLAHLAAKDLTQAILYVDADNTPAVSLYDSLGFNRLLTRRLLLPKS